jgi:hypothetical protein
MEIKTSVRFDSHLRLHVVAHVGAGLQQLLLGAVGKRVANRRRQRGAHLHRETLDEARRGAAGVVCGEVGQQFAATQNVTHDWGAAALSGIAVVCEERERDAQL